MRRQGYGPADWIGSPTCHIQIILRPAGLHATASQELLRPPEPAVPAERRTEPASEQAADVLAALSDVVDPDLGVNIVDLGFVRAVAVEEHTAVITMTLTSAACPLTNVMESQIRTVLAQVRDVGDFRVDWQWVPAWRPADITDGGREQLRAIGFTI